MGRAWRIPQSGLRRLLEALKRPRLLDLASEYRVRLPPGYTRKASLVDELTRAPHVDAVEILEHLLTVDELRRLCRAFDALAAGSKAALSKRLCRCLRWRPFREARAFARSLGLGSVREWRAFHKNNKPEHVPYTADEAYAELGWQTWGDFLGSGNVGPTKHHFLLFEEARMFVQSLGLQSQAEWQAWLAGKRPDLPPRPATIPTNPHRVYGDAGWGGLGDWLGTGTVATGDRVYWPYSRAKRFAQSLGLQNQSEYQAWWRKERPAGIPQKPARTYSEEWEGFGVWLGTGNVAQYTFRPFREARTFARQLKLASIAEWRGWCVGKRPDLPARPPDVPTNPNRVYLEEWSSWGDWLGTRTVANSKRTFRTFTEARAFARRLQLENQDEWRAWAAGRLRAGPRRPDDIPFNPWRTYADQWVSWSDWLRS